MTYWGLGNKAFLYLETYQIGALQKKLGLQPFSSFPRKTKQFILIELTPRGTDFEEFYSLFSFSGKKIKKIINISCFSWLQAFNAHTADGGPLCKWLNQDPESYRKLAISIQIGATGHTSEITEPSCTKRFTSFRVPRLRKSQNQNLPAPKVLPLTGYPSSILPITRLNSPII